MDNLLSMNMSHIINLANVLYLIAYFVRDVFLLRVLTMIGAALVSAYLYNQPQPLMVPVYWNTVFILINLFWTMQLLRQRSHQRNLVARCHNAKHPALPGKSGYGMKMTRS